MPTICPKCYQKVHRCKLTYFQKPCQCVKTNCCKCVYIPKKEDVFPRPCPCPVEACQKMWAQETKDETADDDTDFIMEHCDCHSITLGKTSFFCCVCDRWVCQNCSEIKELPYDGGGGR
jgi:hypothetical protein